MWSGSDKPGKTEICNLDNVVVPDQHVASSQVPEMVFFVKVEKYSMLEFFFKTCECSFVTLGKPSLLRSGLTCRSAGPASKFGPYPERCLLTLECLFIIKLESKSQSSTGVPRRFIIIFVITASSLTITIWSWSQHQARGTCKYSKRLPFFINSVMM